MKPNWRVTRIPVTRPFKAGGNHSAMRTQGMVTTATPTENMKASRRKTIAQEAKVSLIQWASLAKWRAPVSPMVTEERMAEGRYSRLLPSLIANFFLFQHSALDVPTCVREGMRSKFQELLPKLS